MVERQVERQVGRQVGRVVGSSHRARIWPTIRSTYRSQSCVLVKDIQLWTLKRYSNLLHRLRLPPAREQVLPFGFCRLELRISQRFTANQFFLARLL
ncbi:uncharacterized protein BDV14DRAFT_185720 [Aspergillus stella-maris]|uniref:uncharacterized protein n=1 Tax=Aspergillus stella-maris TaxID=1810926 RepID=UPI003CCD4CB2